ncbi:hypothetical protein YC2023_102064 [Brassica napus]
MQNRFDDDEKRVGNGDRPFTKTKRSNRDMLDQNEIQTYASLEKMLHKAIFAIQQLKKKGNTNTSSAPKQQDLKRCNFSSLSNSDLKTNEFSFDKNKAVKTTSKAHSIRCFKCHRIGHYANKCQNQKPLVTLENDKVETEPEKEEFPDPLPIFDDYTHEPMEGLKYCEYKNLFSSQSESIPDESCLQLTVLQPENPSSLELISQFEKDYENILNKDEFSSPLKALDMVHMTLVLEALCQYRKSQMKNKTVVIKQTKKDLPFKNQTKLKKNQIKRSSYVGVMQFANHLISSSREFGPYGSSSPRLDPYHHGPERSELTWTVAEESP